jgi:hypothetical protein
MAPRPAPSVYGNATRAADRLREAQTRYVVGCEGTRLYVACCPHCGGEHWHPACSVPCCNLCEKAILPSWITSIPAECDPRKAFLVSGGRRVAPCGQHEYRLVPPLQPACFAPGHAKNPCARAIMRVLKRQGIATSRRTMQLRDRSVRAVPCACWGNPMSNSGIP